MFAHDWAGAIASAEEALSIDPSQTWVRTNVAHARMFLGEVEEARMLHLAGQGTEFPGGGRWEDMVLDDFKVLRAAGLDHTLMAEIEAAFAASPR